VEDSDPEKIGVLTVDNMANLHVPPDAFAFFWTAAAATDGYTRSMEFVLKRGHTDTLTVTNVGLFESMPGSPAESTHPVVAELRVMREKLSGMTRPIVVGFYVLLIAWVLLTIFRHF
jgi:hypothetical protein